MNVKLLNLKIEALYGYYNYNVAFNPDVTFIYGENGCGKTTILNITEAIITGTLHKLYQYKFSRIVLSYAQSENMESVNTITIRSMKKNIAVTFLGEETTLKRDMYDKWEYAGRRTARIDEYYFDNYPFLREIKKTFNYVYLPLNRSQNRLFDRDYYDRHGAVRNMHLVYSFDDEEDERRPVYPSSIEQAIELIQENQSRINSQIRKINDDFRNRILKASLESNTLGEQKDFLGILREIETKEQLERIKNAYISMMSEIVSVSPREVANYQRYFDSFIAEYLSYIADASHERISIELLLKYQNVKKTERLVKIAEEAEKQKREVQKPLEVFLSIMNDFIGNGEDGKKLCIDSSGNIYLTTFDRDEKIGLQYMSSGEKQLLTFFAHLVFGVKRGKPGIFVVDEPELSLHLSWQKMFVEKALAVNSNIQLIFATHSPEIVGRYRDRMFRLTKTHINERSE